MKKFSWIFALILALSIGFIGCPAGGDDDDDTTTQQQQQGGYTKNPGAQDITITFGTGSGETALKKDGDNNGPIDPGTVTYIGAGKDITDAPDPNGAFDSEGKPTTNVTLPSGTSGYQYAYGTGSNTNYGNSVLRFKVNLGDYVLADYGKVSFDWQAVAPNFNNGNSVNSNKRLYLYATDTEADITPYVEDKNLVVSNINRSLDWYAGGQGDAGVPLVNGLAKQHVEMPINYEERLEFLGDGDDVWLALYVHAESGTYQITNFKLWAGDQTVTSTVTGPAAPSQPPTKVVAPTPPQFVSFDLDLSAYVTTGDNSATYIPASSVDTTTEPGKIIATFTGSNERIVFPFNNDQITAFTKNALNKDVYVFLDATVIEGEGDLFRYHIGDANASSNWNATDSLDAFKLEKINVEDSKGVKLNASNKSAGKGFILNHRVTGSVKIRINGIKIYVADLSPIPPKTVVFAEGDAKVINGSVELVGTRGFKSVKTEGYEYSFVYFKVTFPVGYTLSDYKNISITTKVFSGSTGSDVGGYKPCYFAAYPIKIDDPENPGTEIDYVITAPINKGSAPNDLITTDTSSSNFRDPDDKEYVRNLVIDGTSRVAEVDANEVWIAIGSGGSAGFTYAITDITFFDF